MEIAKNISETKSLSLDEFLKENLTYNKYKNLVNILGLSDYLLDKYLKDPSKMPAGMIKELADLCSNKNPVIVDEQTIIDAINAAPKED